MLYLTLIIITLLCLDPLVELLGDWVVLVAIGAVIAFLMA